jgi:L-fuconolactonase
MYGSDWPVCLLAARYEQVFGLVETYTRQLSVEARERFFGANAARCYRVSEIQPDRAGGRSARPVAC